MNQIRAYMFYGQLYVKAMPRIQNTFIERDSIERFILHTQENPAVSQQLSSQSRLLKGLKY
jgi:hypothetical protein